MKLAIFLLVSVLGIPVDNEDGLGYYADSFSNEGRYEVDVPNSFSGEGRHEVDVPDIEMVDNDGEFHDDGTLLPGLSESDANSVVEGPFNEELEVSSSPKQAGTIDVAQQGLVRSWPIRGALRRIMYGQVSTQ